LIKYIIAVGVYDKITVFLPKLYQTLYRHCLHSTDARHHIVKKIAVTNL
jgi:hypothetical protein